MHINISTFYKGQKTKKHFRFREKKKAEMRNITGMWTELKMSVVLLLLSFLILLAMKGKFISIHTTQIKYST